MLRADTALFDIPAADTAEKGGKACESKDGICVIYNRGCDPFDTTNALKHFFLFNKKKTKINASRSVFVI